MVIWLQGFERHVWKMKKRVIVQSTRFIRQTAFAGKTDAAEALLGQGRNEDGLGSKRDMVQVGTRDQ